MDWAINQLAIVEVQYGKWKWYLHQKQFLIHVIQMLTKPHLCHYFSIILISRLLFYNTKGSATVYCTTCFLDVRYYYCFGMFLAYLREISATKFLTILVRIYALFCEENDQIFFYRYSCYITGTIQPLTPQSAFLKIIK